jgi:hypothetical protein
LSFPLALLACILGHAAGYAIVGASPREQALHGYMAYGPLFVAVCVSAAAVALGLRVSGRFQGRPSPVPLALIGPLAFLLQEVIERLAAGLPLSSALHPVVLVGLVAQLPLALVAYLLARLLLRAADALATWLGESPAPLRPSVLLPAPAGEALRLRPAHTHAGFGRAPPPYRAL